MKSRYTCRYLAVQVEHNIGIATICITADKVYPSQHLHGQEARQRRHLSSLLFTTTATCRLPNHPWRIETWMEEPPSSMHGFPVFDDGLHSWTSPGLRLSGFDHVLWTCFLQVSVLLPFIWWPSILGKRGCDCEHQGRSQCTAQHHACINVQTKARKARAEIVSWSYPKKKNLNLEQASTVGRGELAGQFKPAASGPARHRPSPIPSAAQMHNLERAGRGPRPNE
jgi:hypothetical protein